MNKRIDANFVQQQINHLHEAFPEIWDDPILLADVIEGQTDLFDLMANMIDRQHADEDMTVALASRVDTYEARSKRFKQRIEALRGFMFKLMQQHNIPKLELATATLGIRLGPAKVIIVDEAALPDDCIRIKREPDKVAIKERLQRGEHVEGATLSNQEPVLSIRTK
jgi:hypothetical protein